jgi:hypothetical protein
MRPRRRQEIDAATAKPTKLYSWEPPLAEMLEDPVVQQVMAVDGVAADDVVSLLSEARERIGAPPDR